MSPTFWKGWVCTTKSLASTREEIILFRSRMLCPDRQSCLRSGRDSSGYRFIPIILTFALVKQSSRKTEPKKGEDSLLKISDTGQVSFYWWQLMYLSLAKRNSKYKLETHSGSYVVFTIFAPPASSRRRKPACFSRLTERSTLQSVKAPTANRVGAPSSCWAIRWSCKKRRQRRAASSMASGLLWLCNWAPHSWVASYAQK